MQSYSNPNSDPSPAGGGDSGSVRHSVMIKTAYEDELPFMDKLDSADRNRYCYQKDMIRGRPPFHWTDIIYSCYTHQYDSYADQSFPIVQGSNLRDGVKHYSFEELMKMTNHFKDNTLLCYTMFGTLHRGTIQTDSGPQRVLVKTWEYFYPLNGDYQSFHHTHRIHDELNLLRLPEIKSHPNVVKLIGFHCERRLAVMYEDRPDIKLLESILHADTFTWDDRIKVATDVARMLKAFHDKELVHGGVSSKCIMVNKENCPLVFDFRQFSYCEELWEYEQYVRKLCSSDYKYLDGPPWSMKHDIFAYGVLLMELIYKDLYIKIMHKWLEQEFFSDRLTNPYVTLAVNESFGVYEDTATELRKLGVACMGVYPGEQPDIEHIVKELEVLKKQCCPPKKLPRISA